MKIGIIGGGPAGLTTLKTLLHSSELETIAGVKFEPILFELSNSIGGTFNQRNYENGNLVSSKQLTAFSDHRYPLKSNDHPTMLNYVEYLNDYVLKFNLNSKTGPEFIGTSLENSDRIQLGCRVIKVERVYTSEVSSVNERPPRAFPTNISELGIASGGERGGTTSEASTEKGGGRGGGGIKLNERSEMNYNERSEYKEMGGGRGGGGEEKKGAGKELGGVEEILNKGPGGHLITYENLSTGEISQIQVEAIAICTGLHVIPSIPFIRGLNENLVAQTPAILTEKGLDSVPSVAASVPLDLPLTTTSSSASTTASTTATTTTSTTTTSTSTPSTTTTTTETKEPIGTWKSKEGIRIIHSSQYKNRSEFKNRNVLILGVGETSQDMGFESIQVAKSVTMCHRGGFLSFPKVLNDFKVFGFNFNGNLPIDGLITNLFETTYVHHWISESHLRWHISDLIIKRVLFFLTGTSSGCSQWIGGLPPSRLGRAYVFLNKSSKAMPYINRPFKPNSTFLSSILKTEYLDSPEFLSSPSSSIINLALWPSHVDEEGRVHFLKSSELPQGDGIKRLEETRMKDIVVKPDLVIFCTGYKQDYSILTKGEYPDGPSEVSEREICNRDDPTVGFIGFVRPGVGAIPPAAEMQAMWWTLALINKLNWDQIESNKPHYKLLAGGGARIQYGVDFSAYMSTLAKDIGAAPSLLTLYREHGLHVLICYCFGAAFVSFYRLTGPFRSDEMVEVVKGEIWETITRRGVLGNLFMGLIPMIFYGLLSGTAYVLEFIWLLILKPILDLINLLRGEGGKRGEVSI